jgi:hypothetical protein
LIKKYTEYKQVNPTISTIENSVKMISILYATIKDILESASKYGSNSQGVSKGFGGWDFLQILADIA